MRTKWEYEIPLGCSNEQDGKEIYDIVEAFAGRHNVVWDNDRMGRSMFVYEAEAYNVPSAKTSKFVRYVCQWFAEAIAEHGKDEDERVAVTTVTVRSDGSGLFRSTFALTVAWREWSYTLQQFLVPRHGDEAFYDWDEDDATEKGGTMQTNKLREACANIVDYVQSAMCHATDAHVLDYLTQVEMWAKAALAAPPRNCDKYATADEALKAQEQMFNDSNFANGECKLGCPECDNPRVGCKIAWLFAPATEQEGCAK